MKSISMLFKKFLLIALIGWVGMAQAQINTPAGAVVPFGANKTYAYGIIPTNLPTGGTYGQAQDAANAYNTWKNFYVQNCGGSPNRYRVKFDDPSKTVSEGIAYGMLLAAYAGDKDLFDGLWTYWKAFSTGNGLMNWRVDGGCNGPNQSGSATDSDLDAAYALLIAENQWPNLNSPYDYGSEATTVINNVKSKDFAGNGQALNGDGWGTGNTCRNPSYQSPAYYQAFFSKNSDSFWGTTAVNGAYNMLNANANGTTGLVSDWCDNNGTKNLCNSNGAGGPPTDGYGYDACRNPMRMAQDVLWYNSSAANTLLNKTAAYLNGRGVNNVGGPVYQNGSNYSGYSANATFISTYAMAVMGTSATYQSLLNQLYSKTVNTTDPQQNFTLSGYYGNTLRVLSLFMMSGNMWKLGTTSIQEINVKVAGVDVPANTVFDFQNVQTGTGKAFTFTVENKGFANLNLTGTPKVVFSGSPNYVVNQAGVTSPLALGGTTNFIVTLTPTSIGSKTAVISIANNDPDATESNYTITLVGIGTQFATSPTIGVKQNNTTYANGSTFGFGNATQAAVASQTFQISNTGSAPLNINSITITGAAFSLGSAAPLTVPVGSVASFVVRFTPPAATGYTGSLIINNNDASNGTYTINLSGTGQSCVTSYGLSQVLQDFDANTNMTFTWQGATGFFATATANPNISGINTSQTVWVKRRNGVNDYSDGHRFVLCGSTVNAINMTGKSTISVLVYSPAIDVPIFMALDNNAALASPYTTPSNIMVKTTKANQWERLYFDHPGATNRTDIRHITFQINPLGGETRTFYFDDLKYDAPICPILTSSITSTGVFNDYDNARNISIQYLYSTTVAGQGATLNEFAANPSIGSSNTSTGVAQYIRGLNGNFSTSGFNYPICAGIPFPASGQKIISMLVYSPKVGARLQLNAYNGVTSYSAVTYSTVANQWEKVYFNYSAYTALTAITQLEFFFDATDIAIGSAPLRTYYFDQVQFDTNPCGPNIASTRVFNDFDNNRNINSFNVPLGITLNEVATNPFIGGLNTTSGIASYTRPAVVGYAKSIPYAPCGNSFDLSNGKGAIQVLVYSVSPGLQIQTTLKLASSTLTSNVVATTSGTNAWEYLTFDHSAFSAYTDINEMDIHFDPLDLRGAATYYFDNIRYAPPTPKISLVQGTTSLPSTASFSMGLLTSCGVSSSVDFQINNLGLADLNLTGIPVVSIGGVNPGDFSITYATQFANPVSALSASQFTLDFTPSALGQRSAVVRINSNDATRNPYLLYVSGTTNVAIGATGIINGISTVCSNFVGQYYTASVSGASAYLWTVPSGATLTAGQGTSVVTVNWGLSAGGNLSVRPYSSCVTGTSVNLPVTVQSSPSATGSVIGNATPCSATTATYSIPGVSGATGYMWTVPAGSTILSGNNTNSISLSIGSTNGSVSVSPFNSCGTATGITPLSITISPAPAGAGAIGGPNTVCGSSTSPYSIAPVAGATSYTWSSGSGATISTGQGTTTAGVTFANALGTATLTVTPSFSCGTGAASTKSVTINVIPANATSIVGATSACNNQTGVSYSTGAVSGATSYAWSVPAGATVATGQGTTAVTINYATTAGNITVRSINGCGTSTGTSQAITLGSAPSAVGTIVGNASPCTATVGTYSVAGVAGATSYVWTVPAGSSVSSTTNSASVTFGSTNGNIAVSALNACGTTTSAAFAITLSPAPAGAGAIGGPNTVCGSSTSPYSIAPVAGATSYTWSSGSGATISTGQGTTTAGVTFANALGTATLTVTPSFTCGTGAASTRAVTINVIPANVTSIVGATSACNNQTGVSYSTGAVSGATSYAWSVPAGATVATGQGTTAVTINYATTAGNITVRSINGCGTSTGTSQAITLGSAPSAVGTIVGNASPCTATVGTYSVAGVAGATSYAWTVPAGSSVSSTTNSASVTFGSTNGNIAVSALNTCGTTTSAAFAITLSPAPAGAGAIGGPNTVCGSSTSPYSIAPVAGATSYTWSSGSGATISTGQGTTTAGVTFANALGTATLTVTPSFSCGTGAASTKSVTINVIPANATSIVGATSACNNQTGVSYSTGAVSGATSYAWSVPAGATVATGQGTTAVTINYATTAGNITVRSINGCGTSTGTSQAITLGSAPSAVGTIVGNASPCTATVGTYSVAGVAGATSYVWTVPAGSSVSSTTNSASVTFGSTNGNIAVSAMNTCGTTTSAAFAITLSPAPAGAGAVSGLNTVCGNATTTYTIVPVSGATGYTWTVGTGANITIGQNSTTLGVTFANAANTPSISAVPVFSCGNGASSAKNVTVTPLITPALSIVASAAQVCSGQSISFTSTGSNLGTSSNRTWIVNNVNTGVTTPVYTYTPANNDQVFASITSSGGCFTSNTAVSSTITINVSGTQVPTVGIAILQGTNPTCSADVISFVATSTGGGTSPSYQWKKGVSNVGLNTNTFGGTGFATGDQISVVLTSSLSCASPTTASSNSITLTAIANGTNPCVSPAISTVSGLTSVTPNQTSVTYTVPNLGGVTYTWTVPGGAIINSGQGTNSITVTWGTNGGNVTVVATNNYGSTPVTLAVGMPTGYADHDAAAYELSLFPNPSTNTFSIKMGNGIGNTVVVNITDNKGVLVMQDSSAGSHSNFGADLPAGHYIVTVITESGVKRFPFVKLN